MNGAFDVNSTTATLERLSRYFVGPLSLIPEVLDVVPGPGAPRVFNSTCALSSLKHILGLEIPGQAGAAGLTREAAQISGIGEAVERYAAALIPWDALVYGAEVDLPGNVLGVDKFCTYADDVYQKAGFPVARYDRAVPIYWAESRSLISGARWAIPAAHVYLPYSYTDESKKSEFVAMSTSTGQACHTDPALARLSGLYECIERDAFMITWMRKLAVRRLDIASQPALAALYQRHYADCQVEFRLFELTLDVAVPTVLCVVLGKSKRGPLAVVGCATRLDMVEACEKALLEGAQCLAWARYMCEANADWRPSDGFKNVLDFEDHVRLYCEPEMIAHLDFLLSITELTPIPDPVAYPDAAARIARVLDCLTEHGFDALEVDLTTPELAEAGVHAVKVLVPGMVALTAIHEFPALASPRFHSVPQKLGIACGVAGFNPSPHPFP